MSCPEAETQMRRELEQRLEESKEGFIEFVQNIKKEQF